MFNYTSLKVYLNLCLAEGMKFCLRKAYEETLLHQKEHFIAKTVKIIINCPSLILQTFRYPVSLLWQLPLAYYNNKFA
jgi:hypothetical protein